MKKHTLLNGATLVSLSLHPFIFSDGTTAEGQDPEVVNKFTLQRVFEPIGNIKGMSVNSMKMVLSNDQLDWLSEISNQVDLVILPFPMLTALREQGVRSDFPNCVAFNATPETQREAPDKKVVDINNWSY